ncbi:MAG: TenA family transcriptional regulator [Limisphaerales bacterium]
MSAKKKQTAPQIRRRANQIIKQSGILESAYFKDLESGQMSLAQFRKTQEQFYYAVLFFARPMAALVARMPNPRTRLDILHNVVEEHGDFDSREFHETTFKRFLTSIGTKRNTIGKAPLWPEVRAFNSVLATAALHDEVETGISCLGIIEYAFADISATIGRAVVENGWVTQDDLVHYKLHAAIDKRHAEEFFVIVEPLWRHTKKRYYIDQGLQLGCYIFDRMYRDFHARVN